MQADADQKVVIAENALRALASIRHLFLLEEMFTTVLTPAKPGLEAEGLEEWPGFLVHRTAGPVEMPPRLVHLRGPEREAVALAIESGAALLILDGKAVLEKVKLSFIKAMGTIPLLVQAYQEGRIRAVKPLLVALERKGHEMPPPEQMQALLSALDSLGR